MIAGFAHMLCQSVDMCASLPESVSGLGVCDRRRDNLSSTSGCAALGDLYMDSMSLRCMLVFKCWTDVQIQTLRRSGEFRDSEPKPFSLLPSPVAALRRVLNARLSRPATNQIP